MNWGALLLVLSIVLLLVISAAIFTVGYIRWSAMLAMVELPEPCECGSTKATLLVTNIEEFSDRSLVMVAKCGGCEKNHLVPDSVAEGRREAREVGYHPTYFLTEDRRIVHWLSPEGRTRRLERI